MNFDKTFLPVKQKNTGFDKNKNITKPDTSFKGEPEKTNEDEGQKVYAESVLTNYAKYNTGAYGGYSDETVSKKEADSTQPLTLDEIYDVKDNEGYNTLTVHAAELIELSKQYPHIRDLMNLKSSDGNPRFIFEELKILAAIYEDKDNREAIIKMANIETSKGRPRFSADFIAEFGQYRGYDYFSDTIDGLAAIENDENKPVLSEADIIEITFGEVWKGNENVIKELATLKDENGNPINLNGKTIVKVADSYKEHKDTIVKLCSKKDFSETLTKDLIEAYEKNSEFFDNIFVAKKDVSYMPDNVIEWIADSDINLDLYNVKDIQNMGLACNTNPETFFKLYDLTEKGEISTERFCDLLKNVDANGWKTLKNPKFEEYFFSNLKDIKSCSSFSSDNFVKLDLEFESRNIELDSDGGYKVLGSEFIEGSKATSIEPDGSVKSEYFKGNTRSETASLEKVHDADGNLISLTLAKPSKKNPGVLIVTQNIYDKDGNLVDSKRKSTVENWGENGEQRKIQKVFVSNSGVQTKQTIYELKKGNRYCYEVGDNVFNRLFKVKDENTTETHAWGSRYEAKFSDDSIEVTRTKIGGNTETIKLDDTQIDFKLLPLIKKLPGDFLYTLGKTGTKVSSVKSYGTHIDSGAAYALSDNTIYISDKYKNDLFTLAHEYGHMLDHKLLNDLSKDSKLKEIIGKELDAYKKDASFRNEACIGYFVAKDETSNGEKFSDILAESMALLSGLHHDKNVLLLRSKILQENFPETIAYIGSKIEDAMNQI